MEHISTIVLHKRQRSKEENPGYGPFQACSEESESIKNQLRRRGMTISTLTIRLILEEAGYEIIRIKEKKEWQRFKAGMPLELVQIAPKSIR